MFEKGKRRLPLLRLFQGVSGFRTMPFPNPVEAVIFDMDGLLLDTERIYKVVLQRACTALRYEMSDELFHSLIGVPGQEGYRMLQAHFGPDFPLDAYKSEIGVIAGELLADGVPLKAGAADILLALDGWGGHGGAAARGRGRGMVAAVVDACRARTARQHGLPVAQEALHRGLTV